MRGSVTPSTIRFASAFAARVVRHLVVALPRRIAVLVIALIASLSVTGMASASAQDVINDYKDGGTISSCHPRADYDAARAVPVDPLYGDPQGAIDEALDNPALVGTADRPCPAAAPEPGSGSGLALILIPVAVLVLGGAIMFARRRPGGSGPADPAE